MPIGRFDTLGQAGRYWCFLGIVARVGRRGVLFSVFARQEKRLRLQRLGGRHAQGHQAGKKAYKERHRLFFEGLSEAEKVEYATKMAHDAQIYDEPEFDPQELQSEYYRGLYAFDNRKTMSIPTRHCILGFPLSLRSAR